MPKQFPELSILAVSKWVQKPVFLAFQIIKILKSTIETNLNQDNKKIEMAEKKTCETCGQGLEIQDNLNKWSGHFEHFDKLHNKIMDFWDGMNKVFKENEETVEDKEDNSEQDNGTENQRFLPFFNFSKFPSMLEKIPDDNLFKDAQVVKFKDDENGLEIELNAKDYQPEEIKVRVENGSLIIEGNHEENSKEDESNNIYRKFYREYQLPEGCKSENVTSNFSNKGVLKISAPKAAIENKSE